MKPIPDSYPKGDRSKRPTWMPLLLLLLLSVPASAYSYDIYNDDWNVNDGYWHDASSWSNGEVPTGRKTINILPVAGNTTVARFSAATGKAISENLTIDSLGGASVELNQTGGKLFGQKEWIGAFSSGAVVQSGGQHYALSFFSLGNPYSATGQGTYSLSGSGELFTYRQAYIGGAGSAFTQTGGTYLAMKDLTIAPTEGSSGSYSLSAGELWTYEQLRIGSAGTGTFVQSGGISKALGFVLGAQTTGVGSYQLQDGLFWAPDEYATKGSMTIGYKGRGSFVQSGGIAQVASIELANQSGSQGSYLLSGGSIENGSNYIGRSGTATFTHSGGTNKVADWLMLGVATGGNGSYELSSTARLEAKNEWIGLSGTGSFSQNGGSNRTVSGLHLGVYTGGSGSYSLTAGELSTAGEIIGESGSGQFVQSGGNHWVAGDITLGFKSASGGQYLLTGGQLSSNNTYVGRGGDGQFTQLGGEHSVSDTLYVGNYDFQSYSAGKGRYELVDGSFSAADISVGQGLNGDHGSGVFIQKGGSVQVADTLTIGDNRGSMGSYELASGALSADLIQINADGTFKFTGGRLSVNSFNGNLTNQGGTLAPGASPGLTTINGDYFVTDPASILEVELGGLLAGQFDLLKINGSAWLGGVLDVSLWDGFSPLLGDSFDIVTAEVLNGAFDSWLFPTLAGGLDFDLSYLFDQQGTDIVRLTIVNENTPVPEPGTILLLGIGLLGLFLQNRRRRG